MSELGFDIPPTHRSYGNDDIGFKSSKIQEEWELNL